MKPNLFLFVVCLLAFVSCKKNTVNKITPPARTPDVYVVGEDNDNPVYWKNGVETKLTMQYQSETFPYVTADAIAISGDDIYIAGVVARKDTVSIAIYWKNGVMDTLADVQWLVSGFPVNTSASAIAVSGSDVYVGGRQETVHGGIKHGAILWRNGVPTAFDGPGGSVTSLFLSNGNLYSAGYFVDSTASFAGYYKNGILTRLTDGSKDAATNSIYVVGNDVYAAGFIGALPVYWKNGLATTLSSNVLSSAWSIFVSGSDVYVGGSDLPPNSDYGVIWKNGSEDRLSNGAVVYQVMVSGNDVYAMGVADDATNTPQPVVWKNGVKTTLPSSKNGFPWAMALK